MCQDNCAGPVLPVGSGLNGFASLLFSCSGLQRQTPRVLFHKCTAVNITLVSVAADVLPRRITDSMGSALFASCSELVSEFVVWTLPAAIRPISKLKSCLGLAEKWNCPAIGAFQKLCVFLSATFKQGFLARFFHHRKMGVASR